MNKEINFGYFTFRSLIEPPFNFPNPKFIVPEDWRDKNIIRGLALYELKTLEEFLKNNPPA